MASLAAIVRLFCGCFALGREDGRVLRQQKAQMITQNNTGANALANTMAFEKVLALEPSEGVAWFGGAFGQLLHARVKAAGPLGQRSLERGLSGSGCGCPHDCGTFLTLAG